MRMAWLAGVAGVCIWGCASIKPIPVEEEPLGPSSGELPASNATAPTASGAPAEAQASRQDKDAKYVDRENGFTIERPDATWSFRPGEELATETIAVPLIVANADKGAQVVIQIAPAVASPSQFAERLTSGLKSRGGFSTSDVQPIPLADGAVGFDFEVGDQVHGRVAILEGTSGRVYVLLATWPRNAPSGTESDVNRILGSMKTATPQ